MTNVKETSKIAWKIAKRYTASTLFDRGKREKIADVLTVLGASGEINLPNLDSGKTSLSTLFHDIDGILENYNFQTGKLENCFVPRSS